MGHKQTARASSELFLRAPPKEQRSHLLFVQANPIQGLEEAFLSWYLGPLHRAMSEATQVLNASHYVQHEVDITCGRYPRPPHQYLAIYELSLDGAEDAEEFIRFVTLLHEREPSSDGVATWLYFPIGEEVGHPPLKPSRIAVAFANGTPGEEDAFREFYVTRHIRHALSLPELVSGQFFERTQIQVPGVLEATYQLIAIYGQIGTPESIIQSFALLPPGAIAFPLLDRTRFAEWVYELLA